MTTYVPRAVRKVETGRSQDQPLPEPQPIEDFRPEEAYVLLGPPGAGKTTAFEQEARNQQGLYVTARDFTTFKDRPEWHNTTLFIDGLDETRAGQADGRTPFDKIRARLDELGCPRFRLSCREADWFGATDSERLKLVSPDRDIIVLRIDPLSDNDVQTILHNNPGIPNPENFISEAQKRGIHGLLTNPQNLKMLTLAVSEGGGWPETRLEAFSMACKTLVAEHNTEHEVANANSFGIPELLETSGRMCAVKLLTGGAGFRLPGTGSRNGFISLEQLPGQDRGMYRRCLQSKLFELPVPGQVVPMHREVAEFLAGRYLARLVDGGLPVGRILALVTGRDGVVMPEFRGLVAWFTAQARSTQSEIISRDPVGTILYGDASRFPLDKKRLLLDRLMAEVEGNGRSMITSLDSLSPRLGGLMTPDMTDNVREILDDSSRDESRQIFTVIMLKALNHSAPLPGLRKTLIRMARDSTFRPRIRMYAVDALMRYRESDSGLSRDIKTLVDDILAGTVQDRSDELLTHLLCTLYPDVISETEIIEYLKVSTRWVHDLGYESFWFDFLPGNSTSEQLIEMLDRLIQHHDQFSEIERVENPQIHFSQKLASILLAKLLELSGEEIDLDRLFRWLRISTSVENFSDCGWPAIQSWLEDHPAAWKSLLSMGIRHCANLPDNSGSTRFEICMHKETCYRLANSACPSDFGLWCIDQAVTAKDQKIAGWFLGRVAECLQYCCGNEGLSHNVVLERLAKHPGLRDIYDKAHENPQVQWNPESGIFGEKGKSYPHTQRPDWHDHVKPYQAEFRENRAPSGLLCQLARVYLGGYSNVRGDTPRARLSILLREDDSLVQAILTGFRMAIEQDDLPSYKKILRSGVRNHRHDLAYPIMAGLEEISDPEILDKLFSEERIVRLALAIHYTVPMWPTMRNLADQKSFWFIRLLTTRPGAVADVLVKFALTRLRNRKEASALYDLAYSKRYEEVARLATMPLLEKFPVHCTSDQLSNLNYLLLSASKYCQPGVLLNLIDNKLAQSGMNIAQRIHWLAVGLHLSPDTYARELESYVTSKERRIRFLAEAVTGRLQLPHSMQPRQSVAALRLLIQLIGTSYRPYSLGDNSEEGRIYSFEMSTADKVKCYIRQLATISSSRATDTIQKLLSEENLRPWKPYLIEAAYQQNAVRREAEFRYCELDQALQTLDGKTPANAADLAALTYEKLKEIANEIRHGNADGWLQFWNVDRSNRPERPRPEHAYRDSLIGYLKPRLEPCGIDVLREGSYANETRADIRIAYQGFNVPVEIKKSCHRDLWSAIQTQLIEKYTIDPRAGGNGIYLVLWFGNTEHCRLTPPISGTTTAQPEELEERLKTSLSSPEKFKIQVCVIDVARPNA